MEKQVKKLMIVAASAAVGVSVFSVTALAAPMVPNASDDTLALWLKADALTGLSNGQALTTWADSRTPTASNTAIKPSNLGDSAKWKNNLTVIEGTAPTYTSSSAGFANKPVVHFSGLANDELFRTSDGLQPTLTQEHTIFVVGSTTNVGGTGSFISYSRYGSADQNIGVGVYGSYRLRLYEPGVDTYGNGINNADLLSVPFIISSERVNAGSTYTTSGYIYGAAASPVVTASNPTAISLTQNQMGFVVGHPNSDGSSLKGDIAEIIVYNRALTNNERLGVEEYLANKYFAPVPEPASLALLGLGAVALLRRRR